MTEQPKSTKIAISHTRNLSTGILPINALPVEVLAHIFHLVLQEPCRFHQSSEDSDNSIIFPRFPDYLAQVCSLWRQVAFDCPQLWRHIDLTRDDRWYEGLFARARKHEYLVDQPWIELHIAEEDGRPFGFKDCDDEPHDYQELQGFASSISSRVETLEMVVLEGFGPFHRRLLSGLLRDARRPALKKLVLWSGGEHRNTFIIPFDIERHEMADEFSDFAVNMTEDELARGYSTIDVLHGRGIFPSWSSTAYHGLVDLRLLSTDCWSNIEEREIVSILKSSPGLRILHFGLEIRDLTLDTEHVTPVDLQGLQVVKLFSYNGDDMYPSGILRLLAPGTKPLRLSLEGEFKPDDTWITELDGFFSRSRVAKFYANTSIPPLSLLLCYAANLECVTLDEFDSQNHHKVFVKQTQEDGPASPAHLQSLHLLNSALSVDSLRTLLTYCPLGTVLGSCSVYRDTGAEAQRTGLTGEELSEAFPAVKTLRGSARDPTADWDILD